MKKIIAIILVSSFMSVTLFYVSSCRTNQDVLFSQSSSEFQTINNNDIIDNSSTASMFSNNSTNLVFSEPQYEPHSFLLLDTDAATVLPIELYGKTVPIYLPSEDIVAYRLYSIIPKFDIEYIDDYARTVSPRQDQGLRPVFDWADFSTRIFEAEYTLVIHQSLEAHINEIIRACLVIDGVIWRACDLNLENPLFETRFMNVEIFDRFIDTNVHIELFSSDMVLEYDSDYGTEMPVWIELEMYFSTENGVCAEKHIYLALVEFTESCRIFWDLRAVVEPGCGRAFIPHE